MTENDHDLIARAHRIRSDEASIRALIDRADTVEARKRLEELADRAFIIHERIAFEHYD